MLNITAVFFGGGIGAVLRFLTGLILVHKIRTNLPVATFLVNITGCLLIGFLYVLFTEKLEISPIVRYALIAGLCGGFTTFSTFSLEIFEMIQHNQYLTALLYIVASIVIGLLSVYLGGYFAKLL